MSNVLEAMVLAVGVIVTAAVILMATSVSDRGVDLLKEHTSDVSSSANVIAGFNLEIFDNTTVPTEMIITAAQEYSNNYEIRYQTLAQKSAAVSYKVFPGTERDEQANIGELALIDPASDDYLNPEAMWTATVDVDNAFIMFKQEK